MSPDWYTTRDQVWSQWYEQLVEYKETHADCNVPRTYSGNKGLAKWVGRQRDEYRKEMKGQPSSLTAARKAALDKVGFRWVFHKEVAPTKWRQMFNQLAKYKETHGDCNVPQTYCVNKALAHWVVRQRYEYRKESKGESSYMTATRKAALDKLGFIWAFTKDAASANDAASPLRRKSSSSNGLCGVWIHNIRSWKSI